MGNKDEKVVLEVANITSRQGMDIINMIKDIPMEGRQMRMMSATCYDKPTSSSCEYCDLKNYDDYGDVQLYNLAFGTLSSLDIRHRSGEWYLVGNGDDMDFYAEIKINYCPFCGRKLYGDILDRIDQKDKNLIDLNEEE